MQIIAVVAKSEKFLAPSLSDLAVKWLNTGYFQGILDTGTCKSSLGCRQKRENGTGWQFGKVLKKLSYDFGATAAVQVVGGLGLGHQAINMVSF